MPVTSVRTNDEETELFKSYAKIHGISLSEAYKQALLEKIEDEFDLADIDEAVKRFEKTPKPIRLRNFEKPTIYEWEEICHLLFGRSFQRVRKIR